MKNNLLNDSVFVVNPAAGKLSLKSKIHIIKKIVGDFNSDVVVTDSISHTKDVALNAMKKNKIVVACGGDGIQNIVAEKAVETGGKMAILPLGRGNDFAMSLNIRSSRDLINSFSSPKFINARYVEVNFKSHRRICLTCAGVGLLSEAAHKASFIPFLKGRLLYAVSALVCFILLKNHPYKITIDEKIVEDDFLIMAGAASQYTGGGMYIAPDAYKVIEKINLLYALKVNRMNALKLLSSVFSGKHLNHPLVENLHINKFSISTKSKSTWASLVYGDGEYLGDLPVELNIGKKPLKVLVPM